jgi:hypothetical protein
MKWGLWSTVAASNSATPPDGWPEGMAPSTVNDAAREMMAQIKTGIQNIQFVDLGVTPTETGNTTFTLAGNQMQWYQYGNRVQANVGGTLYYGTVISASFTSNTGVTLRFDPGQGNATPLTTSLSAVATGFPSAVNGALPEIAYRHKNYFINPQGDIWQRGGGPLSISGAVFVRIPDMWYLASTIASAGPTFAISRGERSANASNVPTLAQSGLFLNNSVVISSNVAVTNLAAADSLVFGTRIEGFNYRQFAGKPFNISFWVNSTQTGTYCVVARNTGFTNACVQQFSISSVGVWEQKTINFPKPPSSGTWDYSTGVGLEVNFVLCAGSGNFIGGAGNWTAGSATAWLATAAQTNFAGATGAIKFAAFALMEGNQYVIPEQLDYETEFSRCQRYLRAYGTGDHIAAAVYATNGIYAVVDAAMRPGANLTVSAATLAGGNIEVIQSNTGFSLSTCALYSYGLNSVMIRVTTTGAPLTLGGGAVLFTSGTAQLVIKAEL